MTPQYKKNVRKRSQKRLCIKYSRCAVCLSRKNLTRHHDWNKKRFGEPQRPKILCRKCHDKVEKGEIVL